MSKVSERRRAGEVGVAVTTDVPEWRRPGGQARFYIKL